MAKKNNRQWATRDKMFLVRNRSEQEIILEPTDDFFKKVEQESKENVLRYLEEEAAPEWLIEAVKGMLA